MMRGIISAVLILAVAFLVLFKISGSWAFSLYGEHINRVQTEKPWVALTFDDGPVPQTTDKILKLLSSHGVQATFFITGQELKKNLEDGKKIVRAGHQLANHSYTHSRLIFKSSEFIKNELEATDLLIRQAGYTGAIKFRSPFGKKLLMLPLVLEKQGKKNILWDIAPDSINEISGDAQKMAAYTLDQVRPGSIILMHLMYSSREESLKALPIILEGLKEKGLVPKTLNALLEAGKPQQGVVASRKLQDKYL